MNPVNDGPTQPYRSPDSLPRYLYIGALAFAVIVGAGTTLMLIYGLILGHPREPLSLIAPILAWIVAARMATIIRLSYRDKASLKEQAMRVNRYSANLAFACVAFIIAVVILQHLP